MVIWSVQDAFFLLLDSTLHRARCCPSISKLKGCQRVSAPRWISWCGWWVRIWTGAGSQPAHADECFKLDLFQNINLIGRQQPPSSDSLIWWKSRKVQLDMLFYRTTFLLCLDETRPTCCRYFLFTME